MKYIFITISLLYLGSCMSTQKAIMQTWKINDVQFLDSLNTLPEVQKKLITEKLKTDIQFSFLQDSTYQVRSGNEVTNGKWWFSADKTMLFTTVKEKTVESKIYRLNKKSFSFESAGEMNQSFLFSCTPSAIEKK